jgi:cyanophycin synthetase
LSDAADDSFRLSGRKVYFGPNPLAPAPVVACSLRMSGGGVTADGLEAAAGRLREEFHRLLEEHSGAAAAEEPAVSLARLLAAFARGALNDTRGFVEAAGAMAGGPGAAVLWVGFHDPQVTASGLALAARALREALRAQAPFSAELKGNLDEFQQLCRSRHPDFQARILMVAAKARDIPVLAVAPGSRIWQFGWGSRSRSFFETASDADGFVGARIAKSKALSKTVMQGLGLPTPPGVLVASPGDLSAAAEKVGWPCVAKPLDSGGGKGVTAGIRSLPDLEQSFAYAKKFSPSPVLVEAFVPGEDHRLTVIGGQLVAATRREASAVTGDGVRTIHDLLGDLNSRRSSNLVASGYHYPIAMDAVLIAHLARQDLAPGDVPQPGRRVSLRSNANRSTGGVCFNLEDIHPEVRAMAEELATTLGLHAIGIDYITPDISRPPAAGNGAFIEVNTTPDMAVVVAGGMDEAEIGTRLLGALPGRIPVVLVLAAKTAQHELARQLAATSAATPGLAWLCGDEAGLDAMTLDLTHLAMPQRVAALLKYRTATAAVVVWSFADLQQFGAPVDKADLGLVYRHAELPEPWRRVMEATCGRLIVADTVEEALLTIGR